MNSYRKQVFYLSLLSSLVRFWFWIGRGSANTNNNNITVQHSVERRMRACALG